MKKVFIASMLLWGLFCDISIASEVSDIRTTTLRNGMQVYVVSDKRVPVVMHMLLYRVGGMDDPQGLSGMAHYLEHLMFTGTEDTTDFAGKINMLGGKLNAVTSSAYTMYYELVQKQHLPSIMKMEADRMHGLVLQKEYIERERNVVREERNMRTESTARGVLSEDIVNIFYRNGYGIPVVGWDHEISNYDISSVKSFYSKYYNPNNAVLLIVGDVNFEDVVKLSNKYYGKLKNRRRIARKFPIKVEPPHRTDVTVRMEHPSVSDPEVYLLYNTPGFSSMSSIKEYYINAMASDIIAGHEFGVLYDELVKKKGLLLEVSETYRAMEKSDGMVGIELLPKPGISPETVDKEVQQIIAHYIKTGVPEEYVENAKNRSMSNFVYNQDSLESRAWFYAGVISAGGTPMSSNEIQDTIKSISVEDINNVLGGLFGKPSLRAYLEHGDGNSGEESSSSVDDDVSESQDVSLSTKEEVAEMGEEVLYEK